MRTQVLIPAVLACGVAAGVFAQERIKPKGVADFQSVHASVAEHWSAERWGQCYSTAQELVGVISKRRNEAIRAAMPAAPEGYEIIAPKSETNPQANAMLAAMTAGVGNVIEQDYRGKQGKRIRVSVTADSPMLQMFRMAIDNPAMLQPNQELIKYAEGNAVLESDQGGVTLRLFLGESMVEASFQNADGDFALQVFDQQAVTKLYTAITN